MKFFINQQGNEKITIGGVKSLMDFSDEEVVLSTRNGTVRIMGERMEIVYFTTDEISLKGRILSYEC